MITKKVNRYYCEYCKKAGCSKHHMVKHEKSCTMNPNRECRMCKYAELDHVPITEDLLSLIPSPEGNTFISDMGFKYPTEQYEKTLEKALEEIRAKVNDCPACILAIIRQTRKKYNDIENLMSFKFNYKDEAKAFLIDYTTNDYDSY